MMLQQITSDSHDVLIDMRYATTNNFMNKIIYSHADCLLHKDTLPLLEKAIRLAAEHGYKLKILDAYRPQFAQEKLWEICPDPMYVAPPKNGSHHTRGVAIDLTLVDEKGEELNMGTGFDEFTKLSHHGAEGLPTDFVRNRYMLLSIMMSAGWDFNPNEWWHYQVFKAWEYPLI